VANSGRPQAPINANQSKPTRINHFREKNYQSKTWQKPSNYSANLQKPPKKHPPKTTFFMNKFPARLPCPNRKGQ
jgi:hypothetical protein